MPDFIDHIDDPGTEGEAMSEGATKWDDEDYFYLSSGRKVYCFSQSFGIRPDMSVSIGYDGGVRYSDWTLEEKRELADYMIGLWEKFKTHVEVDE